MNKEVLRPYFLLALLGGALFLTLLIFKPFLSPLILAAIFAVILQSLYTRLTRLLGGSASLASFLTVLVALLCILLPLSFVGGIVGKQAQELYASFDGGQVAYITALATRAEHILSAYIPGVSFADGVSANIDAYTRAGIEWLIAHLGAAFSGVASLALSVFIFFVALYYLLRDGTKVKRAIVDYSPLSDRDDELVFDRLELAVNSVIRGNLLIALIQGVLTAIGFTLFGIPQPVLWGAVAGIAALIPGVGTALVILPAVLLLFLTGSIPSSVGLLAWGVVAVGLVDNFLGPRIVGGKLQLHPLLVLLSVLGGLTLFGPLGIFLGPLSLSLLFAFLSIYTNVGKQDA
ncbi:MAG TPA: AI-2E family transporter [Candidatus Paceibacterota bacterium]